MKRFFLLILFSSCWFSAFSQINEDVEIISSPSEGNSFIYSEDSFERPQTQNFQKPKGQNPLLSPILTQLNSIQYCIVIIKFSAFKFISVSSILAVTV